MARNQTERLFKLSDLARSKISTEGQQKLIPALVFHRFADHLEDQIEIEIPEKHSWSELSSKNTGIGKELRAFYQELEKENTAVKNTFRLEETLNHEAVDDKLLKRLVTEIDNLDLEEDRAELSEEYSSLIQSLMSIDRRSGQITTPEIISQLTAELVNPTGAGSSVHDPTCGIGETLREFYKKASSTAVTGQDVNREVASLAETNLILTGAEPDVRVENSLTQPQFTEDEELRKFDYVISNFPFSMSWDKEELEDDPYNRFFWTDKLPRKDRGDYAFLFHQLAHMDSKAKGAAIVPMGMLFRKHEAEFREVLIEQDFVEAIVTLPQNTFRHTSIATALLILNKDKPEDRKDQIQFIDGTEILDTENLENGSEQAVDRVKAIYESWDSGENSRVVDAGEIQENDYNLNLALYIDTTEKKSPENLEQLIDEVKDLSEKQEKQNQEMIEKLEEIK